MSRGQLLSRVRGLFMGLDCSTQGLKVTVVRANAGGSPTTAATAGTGAGGSAGAGAATPAAATGLEVVYSGGVNYDSDLPHFKTRGGMHVGEDGATVTSPSIMWVEALDKVLAGMKADGFPFDEVASVSGSGQQHGSVYWRSGAATTLAGLKDGRGKPLATLLADCFAVPDSPIWADSSTTEYCRALEDACGGAARVAELSGSRAYERFTANQIAKVAATRPEAWAATERVSLVSSFMASVLAGKYAPIDYSDGAGMNLMHLVTARWESSLLEATAPGLKDRLGEVVPSDTVVGSISPYFVDAYGFDPACSVVAWSGDNPCSVAGLGLRAPGDIGVSLGTSDTLFGITSTPEPGLEGHVFRNPVDPASYMAMLCYKNGSLAREDVRDRRCGGTWEKMEPQQPEITPNITTPGTYMFAPDGKRVPEESVAPEVAARAVIESQFMSMRLHSHSIGVTAPTRIFATGGGSANPAIVQVLADVFGVPVYTADRSDSAALGAAVRALHAHASAGGADKDEELRGVAFDALLGEALTSAYHQAAAPNKEATEAYTKLLPAYEAAEATLVA